MAYKKLNVPHFKLIGLSAMAFGIIMILLLPARGVFLFALLMLLMGVGSPLLYTEIGKGDGISLFHTLNAGSFYGLHAEFANVG